MEYWVTTHKPGGVCLRVQQCNEGQWARYVFHGHSRGFFILVGVVLSTTSYSIPRAIYLWPLTNESRRRWTSGSTLPPTPCRHRRSARHVFVKWPNGERSCPNSQLEVHMAALILQHARQLFHSNLVRYYCLPGGRKQNFAWGMAATLELS